GLRLAKDASHMVWSKINFCRAASKIWTGKKHPNPDSCTTYINCKWHAIWCRFFPLLFDFRLRRICNKYYKKFSELMISFVIRKRNQSLNIYYDNLSSPGFNNSRVFKL